jgi:hypothetical protein
MGCQDCFDLAGQRPCVGWHDQGEVITLGIDIMLPGSPMPLLLMLAIFATKFRLGFEMATLTDASSLGMIALIGAAASGVVAGMFGGRFITYWRAMNARRVPQQGSQSAA